MAKKHKDTNQIAKSILDKITGEQSIIQEKSEKNQAAVELGRLGGLKGGKARAEKLSPEKRKEIAKNAAAKRWGKSE